MSPEKQRIAIAEACGWQDCHATGGLPCGIAPSETQHRQVPDYPNDLNAMHKALGHCLGDCEIKWHAYRINLGDIIEPHRHILHVTAAQQAEALLRMLGKWEDA